MAFPTIDDVDTTTGLITSNSSSWTITYPANIAAGDMLLLFVSSDGTSGFTTPAGFVKKVAGGTVAVNGALFAKLAAGTETGTFTLTVAASEQGSWRFFRLPAADFFAGTIGTASTDDGTALGVVAAAATEANSANPDPANLDPTNWATEDTLWIATCMVDTSRTISVYPLADRNTADVSGGAGGATLGL